PAMAAFRSAYGRTGGPGVPPGGCFLGFAAFLAVFFAGLFIFVGIGSPFQDLAISDSCHHTSSFRTRQAFRFKYGPFWGRMFQPCAMDISSHHFKPKRSKYQLSSRTRRAIISERRTEMFP